MSTQELLHLWSQSTVLSVAVWVVLALVLLYLARRPVQKLLMTAARGLRHTLRRTAGGLLRWERRISERNREVLSRTARNNQERLIEREFARVRVLVQQDLAAYPALQRKLSDQIGRIDEDYRHSVEEPPTPPGWLEAVDAIARIPANGDPMVAKILGDIHETLERACHEAMADYRAASRKRHTWLKRMLPYWRRLNRVLGDMQRGVEAVDARSQTIDRRMSEYEQLLQREAAARGLVPSTLNQFLISSGVLVVLAMVAVVEYALLMPGFAALFGERPLLGDWSGAAVGTSMILLCEIVAGLFFWESLRATRLFPFVGQLEDHLRHALGRLCALLVLVLAAAGALVLMQHPAPVSGPGSVLLALLLPLPLSLVAIPLETALQSGRTLAGILLETALRGLAWSLNLLGGLVIWCAQFLMRVYDTVIFAPLWLERRLLGERRGRATGTPPPAAADAHQGEG